MSVGFVITKVGDTQNMVFTPNAVGPYEIPRNDREELFNGDVKGKTWVNKTKSEIM